MTPEEQARINIDNRLEQASWAVQDVSAVNLYAAQGVAVREFPLKPGHGTADYLLYVNQKAAGVVEAKPEGSTLTGVEVQSEKYSTGLPDNLPAHQRPLPFLYESTGVETQFTAQAQPRSVGAPLIHEMENQENVPARRRRWWCTACCDGFLVPASMTPLGCPKGHPADGASLMRGESVERAAVSILTRPGGRVQRDERSGRLRSGVFRSFQSSPDPEAGCNSRFERQ